MSWKIFLTTSHPPNSQFNLLNLWFLSIVKPLVFVNLSICQALVISLRLWNVSTVVLCVNCFTWEKKNNINFPLKMNIPLLLHQRELALLSPIVYLNNTTSSAVSPASVVIKCKSRLSGSNVSCLTGVSAIIWIICKLALEVSSSVVVCRWEL